MKKEEILALNQIIKSMMENSKDLENAYIKRNIENFNKAKKTMLILQRQIAEITGR
jgi:hypothetical protein